MARLREREYALHRRFANLERVVIGLGAGTLRYIWNADILRATASPLKKASNSFGPRQATCAGRV